MVWHNLRLFSINFPGVTEKICDKAQVVKPLSESRFVGGNPECTVAVVTVRFPFT
jgi:hypothetical protein